jgi:hypothetical protein
MFLEVKIQNPQRVSNPLRVEYAKMPEIKNPPMRSEG